MRGFHIMNHYDMLVIGSGPSGRRAAVQSAKLGKSVLVVDKGRRLGGVSVHTGTIPSKTLRETVLNLSGWRERGSAAIGFTHLYCHHCSYQRAEFTSYFVIPADAGNCIQGANVCLSLRMAFAVMRIFRARAMRATLAGFPCAMRRR